MFKRYGWKADQLRTDGDGRYFDLGIEQYWQAFQAGVKYGNPSGGWEPTKDEVEYAMDRCGVPASDPLALSPCMDGVNVDQFVDGIMEARGRNADPINPSHYKQGSIECIEAIKAALGEGFPDYLRGNVMKYLWRYKEKGGVDDLKKSAWYCDRLIEEVGE